MGSSSPRSLTDKASQDRIFPPKIVSHSYASSVSSFAFKFSRVINYSVMRTQKSVLLPSKNWLAHHESQVVPFALCSDLLPFFFQSPPLFGIRIQQMPWCDSQTFPVFIAELYASFVLIKCELLRVGANTATSD